MVKAPAALATRKTPTTHCTGGGGGGHRSRPGRVRKIHPHQVLNPGRSSPSPVAITQMSGASLLIDSRRPEGVWDSGGIAPHTLYLGNGLRLVVTSGYGWFNPARRGPGQ
jgi:hypothetical protein